MFHKYEKEGYYATRPAGSHGLADVIAIRPAECGNHNHFEVVFEQIKTSQNFKEERKEVKIEQCAFGPVDILWHYYPVKNEKWRELLQKRKEKEKIKKLKARIQKKDLKKE